jgi:DSF synthase
MRRAEEMIMSGRIYTARELYDMGVIDVVAPNGGGEHAVYEYVRRTSKTLRGARAVYECRRHFHPVSYEEMLNITEVWVDTALRIEDKDIKLMNRLVRSQQRFAGNTESIRQPQTRRPLMIAAV